VTVIKRFCSQAENYNWNLTVEYPISRFLSRNYTNLAANIALKSFETKNQI